MKPDATDIDTDQPGEAEAKVEQMRTARIAAISAVQPGTLKQG